jgi:tetratricopeptide (TPR) repeat protein
MTIQNFIAVILFVFLANQIQSQDHNQTVKEDPATTKAYELFDHGALGQADSLFRVIIAKGLEEDPPLLIQGYEGMTRIFINMELPDSAYYYATLFYQAAVDQNNRQGEGRAMKLFGEIYYAKGEFDRSIEWLRKALPLVDSVYLAKSYNDLGRNFHYKHMIDSAGTYFFKALDVKKALKDVYGACVILGNIGRFYETKGDTAKALACFNRSIELADSANYRDLLAYALQGKSNLYVRQGDFRRALEAYRSYHAVHEALLTDEGEVGYLMERIRARGVFTNYLIKNLEQENQIQKLQNQRLLVVIIGLGLVVVIVVLVLIVFRLRNQKKLLDIKGKMQRVQMNPHFVFNALNLLQENILEGDVQASNKFLTKFSSLIRSVLENANDSFHSLASELTFLTNYLELEAMRFKGKFTYQVEIDDQIDIRKINVPVMLFQPFIENAIWHGLLPKKEGPCLLNIGFHLAGNTIECRIEDNGIGRAKSRSLNQTNGTRGKNQSLGIKISEARMANLTKIYRQGFKFEMVDLEQGTLVRIVLPMIV